MSKKKDEKVPDSPEKDEVKSSKRKKKIKPEPVYSTLVSLVDTVKDDEDLLDKLVRSGYYNDYQKELEYIRLGYTIAPSVNVEEFYKKIKNI